MPPHPFKKGAFQERLICVFYKLLFNYGYLKEDHTSFDWMLKGLYKPLLVQRCHAEGQKHAQR